MVEATLQAFGGFLEDQLTGSNGAWGGEELCAVEGGEGRQIVPENPKQFGGVAGGLPSGEGFSIDWG
jgi:hypothetical protein